MIPYIDNPYRSGLYQNTLTDILSCTLTEELNGECELVFKYPHGGKWWDELYVGTVIRCARRFIGGSFRGDEDRFRIYRITRAIGQVFTVYARHITYDAAHELILPPMGLNVDPEPPILETLGDAVEYVNDARLLGEEISLSVNPNIASLEGLFQVPGGKPSNLRQAIFDESWGLASTYGAEVQISDGLITLVPPGFIGEERPLRVIYGLNLAEFSQNDATDGNHQFIFPYYSSNDLYLDLRDITNKSLDPPVVKGILGDFADVDELDTGELRVELLDMTAVIDEEEIEAKRSTLFLAAQNYYRENKAKYQAIPVEITVNISSIESLIPGAIYDEQLNIGDTVTVIYPRWGVETKARCHRVEIDVLKEKAVKVQLGGTRRLVTDTIAKIYKRG